jgi:hypothetical protein
LRKFHLTVFLAIVLMIAFTAGCPLNPTAQTPQYPNTQPGKENNPEAQTLVPSEYQRLYNEIAGKLDTFDGYLNSLPNGKENKITFGAELLPANSHQGDKLLTQENYDGTLLYLDALQSMGVQGVKIAINYPLLAPDFPNSAGYLEYYKNIGQELRKRNMTMLVAIGNLFPDPSFTDLQVSFANLTFDEYRKTKRQIAESIINEIHPDYLTLANEPSTEAMTTGLKVTVPEFTETVNYVLNGLDRRGVHIGAGAGSWNSLDYVKSLARDTAIDYVDIHIYPANYLEQALIIADIAHAGNKRLIIGEAWTYKAYDNELGDLNQIATQADIFSRDAYSFWEPLDSKFLEILARLASYEDYEFISPFWSKYFFGYLDYETVPEKLTYKQMAQLSNQKAVQNILSHRLTGTGLTYQKLISEAGR